MRAIALALLIAPGMASASETVLWYSGNDGTELQSDAFRDYIEGTFLGTVDFRGNNTWGNLNLSDYRFIVVTRPTGAFTPDQISDLSDYLDSGRLLVLVGDSSATAPAHIGVLNDVVTSLGGTMQLDTVFYNTDLLACEVSTVVSESNFIEATNPFSVDSVGNIIANSGELLVNFNYQVEGDARTNAIMAQEGSILLLADYDQISASQCGLAAKQIFWGSMWDAVCDLDEDGATSIGCGGFDCDDQDALIGDSFEWIDFDGDGHGDPDLPAPCQPGAVPAGDDCDDSNADINPLALEVCDDVDNDCNGDVDDGVDGANEWYGDFDGDGFGRVETPVVSCTQPENHVATSGDCDDANSFISPDANEQCNGFDDDCDNTVDEGCDGTTPPPGDTPEKKCSCAVGGAGALWLGLMAPVWLRRRRARR